MKIYTAKAFFSVDNLEIYRISWTEFRNNIFFKGCQRRAKWYYSINALSYMWSTQFDFWVQWRFPNSQECVPEPKARCESWKVLNTVICSLKLSPTSKNKKSKSYKAFMCCPGKENSYCPKTMTIGDRDSP